jgi:membrane protease YdiL (CAAX protease family)
MRLVGVLHFGVVGLRSAEIGKWALLYVLVFILVALTEEFSARGYLLYTLSAGIGFWPAAILTSVFFGYSHRNPGEDWIGLVNAGIFGLLACLLLRRTGNLWMPIGLHMAWDWGENHSGECNRAFGSPAESGSTTARITGASAESGPSTRIRLGPNSAYASSGIMVA